MAMRFAEAKEFGPGTIEGQLRALAAREPPKRLPRRTTYPEHHQVWSGSAQRRVSVRLDGAVRLPRLDDSCSEGPLAPRQRIGQICSNRESVHPPSACLDADRHVETPLPRSGTPKSRRTGLDLAAAAAEGSVAVRSARTAPSRGEPATLTPSMRRVRCNATLYKCCIRALRQCSVCAARH